MASDSGRPSTVASDGGRPSKVASDGGERIDDGVRRWSRINSGNSATVASMTAANTTVTL